MLAQPTRRQHLPHQHHTPTTPSQPYFDLQLLHNYLESQQHSAPFMTTAYTDFANPSIRIQQSTPTPQPPPNGFSQPSMLSTSTPSAWNSFNVHGQSLQTPVQNHNRVHQRAPSSSSVGSTVSQYQAIGPSASYQTFSNHLPTPSHTPVQDSFMNSSNFNTFTPTSATMDQTMAAHMSMKQALMDQGDDVPDFAHSARHSVSSYGRDSPATPHTSHGDEMDFKMPANDIRQHTVPKFERTYTDIAGDTFYDPSAVPAATVPQPKPAQPSLLSPYRSNANDSVQRALQAAQYARSQSPSSSVSRGDSPFRRGSPYRQPSNNFNTSSAAATREQSRQADTAYAMKQQVMSVEPQPKTISPKDAVLDYGEGEDDSKVSLFPDSSAGEYDGQFTGGDAYRTSTQSSYDTSSGQSYRRDSWATPQFSTNFSSAVAPSLPTSSSFSFVQPAVQNNIHNIPLTSTSQYRPTPTSIPTVDQTPEFPAHLTSMESSASEAEPANSQSSDRLLPERLLHKPASSSADTGTYSCTYHGCTQRFETPQKLQKHKREGHRNAQPGPTMTSAALLERNSQAGPHKCERINPTTGKPCNTIFSRPYDLTRHEDTIHNARKQKVRCALCVEEKTFSRNDALTRHMRVVHPEVDFPGKHRRRGHE